MVNLATGVLISEGIREGVTDEGDVEGVNVGMTVLLVTGDRVGLLERMRVLVGGLLSFSPVGIVFAIQREGRLVGLTMELGKELGD